MPLAILSQQEVQIVMEILEHEPQEFPIKGFLGAPLPPELKILMREECSDSGAIDFGESNCQQQSLDNYQVFHVLHVLEVPEENNHTIILQ